jgi:hypothetical protein
MRQPLHVFALAAILAATLTSRLPADGPNLVPNANFDSTITGWETHFAGYVGADVAWAPSDGGADPRSGSLLLSSTGTPLFQAKSSCFPVTPGQRYALGGRAWVDPTAHLPGDVTYLGVIAFAGASCESAITGWSVPVTELGRWENVAGLLTMPAAARSAHIFLDTSHAGDVGSRLRAYFDGVYFRTAGCASDGISLCLANGRFRVTAQWATSADSGAGRAVPFSGNAGSYWFFGADNLELDVKVIDGCSFNNRFWFFAAGLTDVQVVLTVTDTQTGQHKFYTNPAGRTFATITDTNAFATCP